MFASQQCECETVYAVRAGAGAQPLRAPCEPQNVFLSVGATEGIQILLQVLDTGARGSGRRAGVLIPLPQYPLYSATNTMLNVFQVRTAPPPLRPINVLYSVYWITVLYSYSLLTNTRKFLLYSTV